MLMIEFTMLNGDRIFINPFLVAVILPAPQGASIFAGGQTYLVSEGYETVCNRLQTQIGVVLARFPCISNSLHAPGK